MTTAEVSDSEDLLVLRSGYNTSVGCVYVCVCMLVHVQ
jgi:hypothetical protein